jgi:hypothetical protein
VAELGQAAVGAARDQLAGVAAREELADELVHRGLGAAPDIGHRRPTRGEEEAHQSRVRSSQWAPRDGGWRPARAPPPARGRAGPRARRGRDCEAPCGGCARCGRRGAPRRRAGWRVRRRWRPRVSSRRSPPRATRPSTPAVKTRASSASVACSVGGTARISAGEGGGPRDRRAAPAGVRAAGAADRAVDRGPPPRPRATRSRRRAGRWARGARPRGRGSHRRGRARRGAGAPPSWGRRSRGRWGAKARTPGVPAAASRWPTPDRCRGRARRPRGSATSSERQAEAAVVPPLPAGVAAIDLGADDDHVVAAAARRRRSRATPTSASPARAGRSRRAPPPRAGEGRGAARRRASDWRHRPVVAEIARRAQLASMRPPENTSREGHVTAEAGGDAREGVAGRRRRSPRSR